MSDLLWRVRQIVRLVFSRRRVEDELDEEMRHHLEMETLANVEHGLEPDIARQKTERDFGNRQILKEQTRAGWWTARMEDGLRDIRQGLRWLRREPGFAFVAVTTLALGLGANAAVFNVVRATLFESLAYQDPERLVVLSHRLEPGAAAAMKIPAPDVAEYRELSSEFQAFAFVSNPIDVTVGSDDRFEHARVGPVSGNLFEVLGSRAYHGRTFVQGEAELTTEQLADTAFLALPAPLVLAFGYWERRFGADKEVVGRTVIVNGQSMVVIGVMPSGFSVRVPAGAGIPRSIDAWTPLRVDVGLFRRPTRLQDQDSDNSGVVIGRLSDGSNLARARQELAGIAMRQRGAYAPYERAGMTIDAELLQDALVRPVKSTVVAAQVAVAIVLLIICANLASLLASRALRREREMAVRAALGAGRGRLIRQLVAECALLTGCGAVGAIITHGFLSSLVLRFAPAEIGVRVEALPAHQMVWAMFALAAVSMALATMAPVMVTRFESGRDALAGRIGVRGGGGGRPGWRKNLIVAEVVLTMVLVVAAGLMYRSLIALQEVDPGFLTDDRVAFEIVLSQAAVRGPADRAQLIVDLRTRLMEVPGVRAVGFTGALPLSGRVWRQPFGLDGEMPEEWGGLQADFRVVNSDFFRAMGIRRLAGRSFSTDEDLFEERRIVMVDAALAARLATDANPVGQFITIPLDGRPIRAEIVGVVESVRHESLRQAGRPTIYVPYRQEASRLLTAVVFGDISAQSVETQARRALEETGQAENLPTYGFRPFAVDLARDIATTRFIATITFVFAIFSVFLAAIGLYGVVAYSASDRRCEFGLRLAIGATPGAVLREVFLAGTRLTAVGLGLGTVLALVFAYAVRDLLVGVSPTDPGVWTLSILLFGAVTVGATLAPAWRASRIDPSDSLRAP